MKKKVLVLLAIFGIVGSMVFAQSITVTNEIYSELAYKGADGDNWDPIARGFWGVRERPYLKLVADRYDVEARYSLRVWNNIHYNDMIGRTVVRDDWENVVADDSSGWMANFWLRPWRGWTFVLGNDYYVTLPPTYLLASDTYMGMYRKGFSAASSSVATAKPTSVHPSPADDPLGMKDGSVIGRKGFSVVMDRIERPNITLYFNTPSTTYSSIINTFGGARVVKVNPENAVVVEYDFRPALNAAINWHVSRWDLGLMWKGGTNTGALNPAGHYIGLFAGYGNGRLAVKFGASSQLRPWLTLRLGKIRLMGDIGVEYTFRSGAQMAFATELGFNLGRATRVNGNLRLDGHEKFAIMFYTYFAWPFQNGITFSNRLGAELLVGPAATVYAYAPDRSPLLGQWFWNPKVAYRMNERHEFSVGVKLRTNFWGVNGRRTRGHGNYIGYAFPVYWKYTF